MLRTLADWIASTAVSRGLQNALWVIPTSQSVHLIAIGIAQFNWLDRKLPRRGRVDDNTTDLLRHRHSP